MKIIITSYCNAQYSFTEVSVITICFLCCKSLHKAPQMPTELFTEYIIWLMSSIVFQQTPMQAPKFSQHVRGWVEKALLFV